MAVAIQLQGLTKHFGRRKKRVVAVKDADLTVEAGQVYGFLGPNGAGKTTTIRMMLDLIRPTEGTAHIFGKNIRQNHEVLRRVGALVEGAKFYPYLSGRKNLEVLARTNGNYDKQRVMRLLEQVGLAARANQRYKGYSTGMKQRLGLAAALLHDPELIILDEPTNGLDPAGIQEMRTFIRDLVHQHGKTVFLSSHMLNEVEQVCDRVAIINKGEIIREGAVSVLLETQARVRIQAQPLEKAASLLQERWQVSLNGEQPHTTFVVESAADEVPHIVRRLVENDIDVYEVTSYRQSLEAFFLTVTHDNEKEKTS